MKAKLLVVLSLQLAAFAAAKPATQRDESNSVEYAETRLTRAMDELNARDTIGIYGDMITLEKIPIEEAATARDASDPLMARIDQFFNSRKIHIVLPSDGSSADLFGRALGRKDVDIELRALAHGASEARTKLKRMILPILLALKLKALIILPIVITLIGLIGIKGLGAGLMSLLLSGAVALKALLTPPPPPRVTYGIVKPHDIHHDHWHRSQEEINQPYRGWAPEYNGEQYPYQDIP